VIGPFLTNTSAQVGVDGGRNLTRPARPDELMVVPQAIMASCTWQQVASKNCLVRTSRRLQASTQAGLQCSSCSTVSSASRQAGGVAVFCNWCQSRIQSPHRALLALIVPTNLTFMTLAALTDASPAPAACDPPHYSEGMRESRC